jgi:hypothetical protein
MQSLNILYDQARGTTNTVKKVPDFFVPSQYVTNLILPVHENLIIPGQDEFG